MKCKDCEKYMPTAEKSQGVCSLSASWFPIKSEDDCHYISFEELKCKDCSRFGNDFACYTVDENDSAEDCIGFIDIQGQNIYNALWDWFKRGIYSREKVMELCDKFEKSEEYRFFKSMNRESDLDE
ncbi:MAG: hypothetical protein K2O60_03805 [Ruminococcus sp.]|nr:hypothetical protein [Ruminococcus sp.]